MIEAILVSIAANIVTGLGQKTLKRIIKNDSLEAEIEKAFNEALDKWTVNYGIKEKEKIFTSRRFDTLIDCIKEPEKIHDLDKSTSDIIEYFKQELQKSTTAWNYIQDVQFQEALNRFNLIEHHLNGLKKELLAQLEHIEKQFDDALLSYKDAFSQLLNPENKDLPNQFQNTFIGRESDLESIDYLLKVSDYKVISIISDGGYGKTRLCIEYFQKYVDTDENIDAWVLNTTAFKNLNLSSKLKEGNQTIILIDDAHKYPKILNDVVNITNRNSNVKILMTVRNALYDVTVSEFASHNRNIASHSIERLSYEETQELFKSQLPWLGGVEIKRLAQHSKGIPIVILGLCQVTINGKYKSEISEEENFRLFVQEQKQQVINDINAKYFIDKGNVNKTIELLSFFAPIKNTDEEITQISSLNGINVDESALILDYLEKYGFIVRNNEIVITPDPYSDTILLDSSPRIKYLLQSEISVFLDRLIRNLIEVEKSERLTINIDNLLSDFISSFKNKSTESTSDISSLVSNLETLKSFTYKKPRICFYAIRDLIESKLKTEDFWQNEEMHVLYEKSFKEIHDNIETILSIITFNTHDSQELEELYELIWTYKNHKSESSIFGKAFGYKVYDFIEYGFRQKFPFQRQKFLLSKLDSQLKEKPDNEFIHNHIFACVKFLMVEDFEGESHYDKYTHAFSWARHHVYQNEHTEKIRLDSLNLLFRIYELVRYKEHSKNCFDKIIHVLYFMSKTLQDKNHLDQTKEVEIVLDFLHTILDKDPSIKERSKIIRQLKIYERREIKEEYKAQRDELLLKSESVDTVKERLSLLFLDEYFSLKNNIDSIFKEIIAKYNDNLSFFEDIIEVKRELINNDYSNFNELLSYLIANHPTLSKELLDFVITNHPEHVCDFRTLVKANYKDNEYFYLIINKVWSFDFECSKGSVLWMLTNGRNREVEYYREDDLKYFEDVVKNKLSKQLWSTSFSLPKYILINPERTLNLITSIFEISENEREDGYLLHSIFEDKEIIENNTELIKTFVFSSTHHFPIDYHYLGEVLNFLENYFGFDTLLKYLIEKIKFIEKSQKPIYLSYHKRYTNPNKSLEQTEKDFIQVIKWYAELESKSDYIHKVLVEFLRPEIIESESFKTSFKELVESSGDDIDKVVELCRALDVFENKGEYLISLLIEVANEICNKYKIDNQKLITILGRDYIFNNGTKSGPAGGPFPQDLAKKKEIKRILGKYDMHPDVKSIFDYALKNVNGDIKRDLFRDEKW
ncbi:hypothetical protein JYB62_10150 [Algoriphagus lutimaris]|uniref:hypothetical protein n=1 Tax=Algoriphagus lutimaris TaxID=613197 RepID=UPI00196A2051|nr:hypothetical protein [Algoriphagus lutimaris]MBN3520365.1 hypothetical protein [Algoriphagus lutimaris]